MYRFRNLHIGKGARPMQESLRIPAMFNLPQDNRVRFNAAFWPDSEKAETIFKDALLKHTDPLLRPQEKEQPLASRDEIIAHIEFQLRSSGTKSPDRSFAESMVDWVLGQARTSPRDLDCSMFHSMSVVIDYLLDHREVDGLVFLERLAATESFADPLFLAFMLHERPLPVLFDARGPYQERISFHAEPVPLDSCVMSRDFSVVQDMGGFLAVFAVDGQLGGRVKLPKELLAHHTASAVASILAFGIVPGGVLGGEINHDKIHFSLDRPDIDLLSIFSDSQAVLVMPASVALRNEGGYQLRQNAKIWVAGDRAPGTELALLASDALLPWVAPSNLVLLLPMKLTDLFVQELTALAGRLALTSFQVNKLLNQIILYDQDNWGSATSFLEGLQASVLGRRVLEEKFGKRWQDFPLPAE